MNARALMITAGAMVALAAPAVASATTTPSKHSVKKHVVKEVWTRQGTSRQLYIYVPGPVAPPTVQTEQAYEDQYNEDLIEHGLDPITFPSTASTSASDSSQPVAAQLSFAVVAAATPSVSTSSNSSMSDDSDDC